MNKTTVDLTKPSLYAEPNSHFHRIKRKITYRTILKLINNHVKKLNAQNILEIGTGSGYLISLLEEIYPNIDIEGIEYDDRLVELTRTKLKNSIVTQGNAENFTISHGFDIIVSLQVIEHLYSPELMLDSVLFHLKPGGTFIFTTPNLGCVSNRFMKDKWHGFREDHVSLKSRMEWDKLLISKGFKKEYSGSTFFTGIPFLNKLPFGLLNWLLLYFFGSLSWSGGESYIGVFKKLENNI